MKEVTIIGIDLAKRSFQVHGATADGSVGVPQETVAHAIATVSGGATALHCGDGGLRDGA